MYRTVRVGHRDAPYKESACADSVGILPGHLLDHSAPGQIIRTLKVGPVPIRVAVENNIFSGTGGAVPPSTPPAYEAQAPAVAATPYLSGDQVIYQMLGQGAEFLAWVNTGNTAIAYNDFLESAGDGTVRKSTAPGVAASLQQASATSLATGITHTALVGGAAGNEIKVTIATPGSFGVTVVDGNQLTITPATGNSIAQLVTALNANATYSGLLVASATDGTGAATVAAATGANLAGGLDGGQETANMRALAALTNTSGAPQQLLVEVIG